MTGARFALEPGRGRTAVPVRSTIFGAALGLAALTMAFTFGAGLNNLLATPRLYGTTWDAHLIAVGDPDPEAMQKAGVTVGKDQATRRITDGVSSIPFLLDGVPADALSFPLDETSFLPPVLTGRLPRGDDELLVGPKTLKLIRKRVGDTVSVSALGTKSFPFKIVGIGVIPATGHTGNIGEGTFTTYGAFGHFFPADTSKAQEFMISFHPTADREAAIQRIQRTLGEEFEVARAQQPADIVNFGRNRNLPLVLAGFLALLAAGTIAHLLVTGIARRRRDLAILKSVGFVRRQLRGAVAWQASILACLAVVIGIPVGDRGGSLALDELRRVDRRHPRRGRVLAADPARDPDRVRARQPHRDLAGAGGGAHARGRGLASRVTELGGDRWTSPDPGLRGFYLRGDPDEQVFASVRRHELNADRQAVVVPVQRQ